ncbi:MAG: hypothetical protein OXL37_12520 [Chloroflexota bacterium]|nr:hypothetical protein [Chloroflexota bacterium]MDE2959320.1 hypothetical protein [Chloroflexota bacterium]
MDSGESERRETAHGGGRPTGYEPVPSPPPVPPDALKPWYYQGWFLVPTFVWWPCSAILFIRSPWHNGIVSGALSWAWIIVGGGFIFLRMQYHWQSGEPAIVDPTLWALAAPGILLTIITQTLWLTRDRPRIRRIRQAGGFAAYENADSDAPPRSTVQSPPPERTRRRDRGSVRSRRRRR